MPSTDCKRGDPTGDPDRSATRAAAGEPATIFGTPILDDDLESYDYELPPDRIAQRPADQRDGSRLLSLDRSRDVLSHHTFADLPRLLDEGDLLVINDTRVIPARIRARKPTGAAVEVLLLHPLDDACTWEALVRPSARVRPGTRVLTDRGDAAIAVEEALPGGHRRVVLPESLDLSDVGEPPLPPYIRRPDGADDDDHRRYQTVYARHDGAVAAPTAGLHFTPRTLSALDARGVHRAAVTLHVGIGTFEPVRGNRLSEHAMHAERYRVPPTTIDAIERARARGSRVVAVGTTVVRTLESWALAGRPGDGQLRDSDLFIRPGFVFDVVDGLVTNFHLPRSTLLALVSALVGRTRLMDLYREGVEAGYRFYSYGDAMLLL